MEKINNCIDLCEKIEDVIYSDSFYPLSQIKNIRNKSINFFLKGLNKESEKKMIAFCPLDFLEDNLDFPVKFFKIEKKSKFIDLEHKHYLGTILSLGIKREVLGDLIVKEQECYGIIIESIFDFLKDNLSRIRTSPVEVIEVDEDAIPKIEFTEFSITVPSLRLDSIISEISKFSRTKSVDNISLGNIQVNYEVTKEKNYKINETDVIIVKKIGKFIVEKVEGVTKKNKTRVLIKKYV